MKRREFLKYFSLGVAGPAFSNFFNIKKRSVQHLYPYVIPPEGVIPGVPNWYASVCRQCSAGCGIQVKVREGRAKKIEGNPLHPVNEGRLCARGQAGLQVLYNPDRITGPMLRTKSGFKAITWAKAEKIIADQLTGIRDRGHADRIAFLTEPVRGTLGKLISTFSQSLGSNWFYSYEVFGDEALAASNLLAFGHAAMPDYDLANSSYIMSFGAGFLDTWASPVKQSVGYGKMRDKHAGLKEQRGWLVQFEPRLSVTGANADEWFPIKPGSEGVLALGIAHIIVENGDYADSVESEAEDWRQVLEDYTPQTVTRKTGVPKEELEKIAKAFAASEAPVALCGGASTAQKSGSLNAYAAALLNHLVGSVNRKGGVRFPETSPLADAVEPTVSHKDLTALAERMRQAEVEALFIRNNNLDFSQPAAYGFSSAISGVPFVVSFSSFMDDTTSQATLVLPEPTYLESWGDYVPLVDDGRRTTGLMQPAVESMHDTRHMGDVLLSVAKSIGGATADALPAAGFIDYLKESWQTVYAEAQKDGSSEGDFERFWDKALTRGGWWTEKSAYLKTTDSPSPEVVTELAEASSEGKEVAGYEFHLWPYPSMAMYDGRGANQPWLQQLPEPLVTGAWGTWAEINPETAKELGVEEGDLLEIKSANGKLSLPAYIYQAIEPKTIAVPVGRGHKSYGRFAKDIGKNPLRILEPLEDAQTGALAWASTKIDVVKGSGSAEIIKTEPKLDLPGMENGLRELDREIVQWIAPEEAEKEEKTMLEAVTALPTRDIRKGPHFLSNLGLAKYRESKFQKYAYRWGMVIDLDKCTGCSACMVACYAENNLPIVSPEELAKKRHKNWIRVDRYWEGEYPKVRAKAIPINCMQCGNAPCESVCPVYAAYHTQDGLNGQVYQRCVGTRYCNANCPYRSRLFNWLNSDWPKPLDMQLNPDVSVRTSGMTDKCSFCVQRIREAKDISKDEDRRVRDGEIQTACSQTCPSGAITFGDLLDPKSRVSQLTRDSRRYRVLEEMATEPAVIYLKAVKKGAEEHASEGAHGEGKTAEGEGAAHE